MRASIKWNSSRFKKQRSPAFSCSVCCAVLSPKVTDSSRISDALRDYLMVATGEEKICGVKSSTFGYFASTVGKYKDENIIAKYLKNKGN